MKKFSPRLFIGRTMISVILVVLLTAFPLIKPSGDSALAMKFDNNKSPNPFRVTAQNVELKGIHFKSLPIRFEPNVGQTDSAVRFIARDRDGMAFLTAAETVLRVSKPTPDGERNSDIRHSKVRNQAGNIESAVLRLHTVGSNPHTRIEGLDPLPGSTNYFIGNDPKKWRTNVPSYAKVKYAEIYAGIDLIYYGNEGNLEYDFNVAPGADPSRIAISVEGAEDVEIDDAGNLLLRTRLGEVRQPAPHIYQKENGKTREITGRYVFREDGNVGFKLDSYDVNKTLVIDPQLIYATYLGGSGAEFSGGIAVDSAGSAYITGLTQSFDFPTRNPLQGANTAQNAYVAKLSPDGSSLVYSTYLGGTGGAEGKGIVVDTTGAAYLTGSAGANFPMMNPLQGSNRGGQDAFVTKLSPDGASLIYSTYLGGSGEDLAHSIKLDGENIAYVVGETNSADFPKVNPLQAIYGGGDRDGFLSIIAADGASVLFSIYLGGNGDDTASSCDIHPQTGDVYVGLTSDSTNLKAGSSLQVPQADTPKLNRILAKIKRKNPRLFEFLEEDIELIVVASLFSPGEEFLIGELRKLLQEGRELLQWLDDDSDPSRLQADSSSKVQPQATSADARLTVTDAALKTQKTVYFGGRGNEYVKGLANDSQGAAYIVGQTDSQDLPTVNPVQSAFGGGPFDAFVAVFSPDTLQPVFATYIGGNDIDDPSGIAVDPQGNIYVTGLTFSTNLPVNGVQTSRRGITDAFLVKISAVGPVQTGPDFSLGFDQATVAASAPSKVNLIVNITRSGGFTGNVTVTPGEITAKGIKLSTDPVATIGGSVKFKVKLKGSAKPGSYPITFTGKDDSGRTRMATVTLQIQ